MPNNNNKAKRVTILTNNLGCERHLLYNSRIEKYFKQNGWEVCEHFDELDLIVYSACGFHDVMKNRVFKTYNILKKKGYPDQKFVIMGCLPKTHEIELKNEFKGQLIYLHKEEKMDDIINASIPFHSVEENSLLRPYKDDHTGLREDMFFIKIAEGCLCKCTYCVIKRAKGYIKSFPKNKIMSQFQTAIELGYRKIFLTAEDVFAYGYERNDGIDIVDLLESMLAVREDVVFYFNYINPVWLEKHSDYILSLCTRGKIGELWIPLQHINEKILEKMGRPVNFNNLYTIIKGILRNNPHIFTTTDIIVGFPGETEEIFQEVVNFFKQDTCFKRVYHFGYGDLKGAKSSDFTGKVEPHIVSIRWGYLKKALGPRSPYNQPDSPAHQFGLTYDYIFCKNTYEELEDQIRMASNRGIPQN